MTIRLYNSYGRKLMAFRPLVKGQVRMYTCGPTVWNYAHVGNLRTFLFEDLLRRYLKFSGYKVVQVKNITDVEDKIIKGMKQFGKSLKELTEFYAAAFMEDLSTLRIERAEYYPRATEHISEMLVLIKRLKEKGLAYQGEDRSIYYDISKFKRYGKLSGVRVRELKEGARVSQDHYEKEEAHDFALWKRWDEDDGEVFWQTEFGKGRPGWHIECSAKVPSP
ncbi:MAG: class I tRNA ligase family protein [Thaumarchaeota archaeon]|nr:class I tRNA ligase family protein [Nitrososphaerota archaeon]